MYKVNTKRVVFVVVSNRNNGSCIGIVFLPQFHTLKNLAALQCWLAGKVG